ncbi:MAG TPA: phosphoribosyltransferase family protein [Burkholderiales bacterium]|nr:phosphoribosyltransferase family protein [Burkholderiales bacterium]
MKPAFRDRAAAGARLAAMLEKYRGSDAVVLAIPAGGVPVGAALARELGLSLHAAPVSKVLYPWTTESGFGAVAFDGSVWLDEEAVENSPLTKTQVEKAVGDARAKVERRTRRFGVDPSALKNSTVILVDDGIAAGSTMRTAIAALRKLGASRIIVAVPTAPSRSLEAMRKLADEIACPNIRGGGSFAVADAYQEWHDLSDDEVEAMLKR